MTYFKIILLFFLVACSGEKKDADKVYDSLSAAIIDGFLTKDSSKRRVVIMLDSAHDKTSIYTIFKSAPEFNKSVRTKLNVSDSTGLMDLIDHSPLLDTTSRIATLNVRYANRLRPEGHDWRALEMGSISEDLIVVTYFLMLTTKDRDKCVVFTRKLHEEKAEIAELERKNNKWHISSVKQEFLYVVE